MPRVRVVLPSAEGENHTPLLDVDEALPAIRAAWEQLRHEAEPGDHVEIVVELVRSQESPQVEEPEDR